MYNVFKSRKGKLLLILPFLIFFLSLNFVSAQPLFVQSPDLVAGYKIRFLPLSPIPQNEDFTFHFHIFNISDGSFVNDSTICFFHLYNSSGEHIYIASDDTVSEEFDYEFLVDKGNFTETGQYAYNIQCELDTGFFAGFESVEFEVTPSGRGGNSYIVFSTFVILLIYLFTFASFFYARNIPLATLGGMAMIFLGVYTIRNGIIIFRDTLTNYISYVTIAAGFIIAIWAILEQLEVI